MEKTFFGIYFGLLFHLLSINISRVKIYDEEKVLLEGLATNDTNAIETIYRENYTAIQAYVVKNNGYPDDARDVFQEAMIILFEKAKSDSFVLSCQIKTYLYSVCRRLWLKKLQKQNRYNPSIEMIQEIVPVEDEVESHEKRNVDFFYFLQTGIIFEL